MSKRIVSVMLVFLMLMSLSVTSFANDEPNVQAETTTYRDTDSVSLSICQNENGNMVFAGIYKDTPSVVYQWVGTISEFQSLIPEENPFDYLEELPFTALDGIESFDLGTYQNNTQITRDYNRYEARAVEDDMADRYGDPYEWYPRYTESTDYAPLVFKIREDLNVSSDAMGLESIPAGITISAWALSFAAGAGLGATAQQIVTWVSRALNIYTATEILQEARTLQMYRGYSVTLRISTVTAPGESEMPLDSASRSYIRYYAFDDDVEVTSQTAGDAMSVLGTFECIYTPSEYDFNVVTMIENAYEIYMEQ